MNPLKVLGGVVSSRLLGRPVPIAITMALTYRCNLRCGYCQIWRAAGEELTTQEVLAAIDELCDAGMCRLGLTGGEPLLRDDIGAIIGHAKHQGLFTSIFTNGALVRDHLDALRSVDVVLLSLDGPRNVHDLLRGEGSFESTIEALELLRAEGIPIWTNTVITRHNTDCIDYVTAVAGQYGARAAFQPVFEHSYSVDTQGIAELRARDGSRDAVIEYLLELKKRGEPLLNCTAFFEKIRSPREASRCLAGLCYGAVTPDGRIAPCPVLLQAEDLPDGRALGYARAFEASRGAISCEGCDCIATVESDLLFSLNPNAVTNTLAQLLARQLGQRT
jgi:MoaA/NifB/PqqE/SkfB family radical SAM enzyme